MSSTSSRSTTTRSKYSGDWSEGVVDVLERIRDNSVRLAEHHRRRFYHFKGFSKYFDVPVLVLSIFGSSFAVGTQHYLNQRVISATSCLIGVIVSIITSIKLYLSIETSMQSELKMSKSFYTLSIDIHHVLLLAPKERGESGLAYMQKIFGTYSKLMEESNLFQRQFEGDRLAIEQQHKHLKLRPVTPVRLKDHPFFRGSPPPPPGRKKYPPVELFVEDGEMESITPPSSGDDDPVLMPLKTIQETKAAADSHLDAEAQEFCPQHNAV